MYNFIDVTEISEGVSLPSEALKINGEYIENQIAGYRTLAVEGREALSPEISSYETGIRDGSTMQGKRYPARTIRIIYQLIAASNEEFREAYNKLGAILNVNDAELIFNDEQDKYFTGTPSFIGEVEPGRNAVVGEFEILCLDPFKYSVMEYEAVSEPGEASVLLNYNGTYKCHPKLQAEFYNENEASEDGESVTALTGNGDCGYVAFFTEDKKIIQLGDPEEADGEDLAQAQTLINQSFNASSSWGTAAKSLWAVNGGLTSSSAVQQAGAIGMKAASYTVIKAQSQTTTLLTAKSTAEAPYINYRVTSFAYDRTANSVKVLVQIATWLDKNSNYFGRGYSLSCTVSIGSTQRTVVLKEANEYWSSTTEHIKSFEVSLSVGSSATSIGNVKFKAFRTDSTGGQSGVLAETACKNIVISAYVAPVPETYYLSPTNYGTGTDWHGPSITRTIPADTAGNAGATDFKLTYSQKMSIGSGSNATNQLGAFQMLLVNGSGTSRKIVAGVNVYKGSAGKNASLRFYLNGSVKETMQIDLSYGNKYFNSSKTSTVTKDGNTVTFDICGIRKTYTDAALQSLVVNEVTFTMTQFGTKTPLDYNGLYWVKFVKNQCDTWKEVPNKFSGNDIVEADCSTGAILLNGLSTPSLGALGNDWEDFCLTPGLNQIGFAYSEWLEAAYAPTFKVKYREVFL